jgi:alanine transaminase
MVEYFLQSQDERWVIDANHMRAQHAAAKKNGTNVRAIVVINPGNPTGQVLSYENVAEILKFAHEEDIPIIADEVYQENMYQGSFISFKAVAQRLGLDNQIASLHSTSKGFFGECGLRGGYMELWNFDPEVKE